MQGLARYVCTNLASDKDSLEQGGLHSSEDSTFISLEITFHPTLKANPPEVKEKC